MLKQRVQAGAFRRTQSVAGWARVDRLIKSAVHGTAHYETSGEMAGAVRYCAVFLAREFLPTMVEQVNVQFRRIKMNWDQIEGKWKQSVGKVKEKWGKLTDDDLTAINGKRDQLIGKIQERYGIAKEAAQKQVDEFTRSYQSDVVVQTRAKRA
jgi:uncharacterized protein YjbJ (UPF0337 family)